MNNIKSYFNIFPLLTKKSFSYDNWLSIHNIITNKLHLTEAGLAQVRKLQKKK